MLSAKQSLGAEERSLATQRKAWLEREIAEPSPQYSTKGVYNYSYKRSQWLLSPAAGTKRPVYGRWSETERDPFIHAETFGCSYSCLERSYSALM